MDLKGTIHATNVVVVVSHSESSKYQFYPLKWKQTRKKLPKFKYYNNETTKDPNTQGQITLYKLTTPILPHLSLLTKGEKSKNISSKKGNTKPLINKLEFINTKPISQKLRQGFWSAHQIITNKYNYYKTNWLHMTKTQ